MPLCDPHKRLIDYLRISITDRCNLSCFYCKPRAGMKTLPHHEILSYEEVLRLVALAVPLGISRVRVTGGEPLVRRGIIDFIASLNRLAGIEDISITTNGVLLEEMADGLIKAGKPRLNISLDSLDPHTFRKITGSDNYDRVWRGINRAEKLGFFPLKINMVPVRGMNDAEVADFARLTLDRRLHVRFIEYMPIGADDRWRRDSCVPSNEIRAIIEREVGPLKPFFSENSAGPSDNYQLPDARGVIGFISPITRHFCGSCRRLRLTADGKIRPCLLSDTEIDVKSPLRSGCDDAELERLFRLALEIKPDRHYLNETGPGCFQRTMSRIGG
ncbi:MAG: GTP 3',8-cyclase MoaA [Nitrospirae bacterium]|nr:GTP 3',8-cyclase MoaA [Nitrospirota bacterium]